jgi:hypothetical protein
MMVHNKICYTRKKERKLHEKKLLAKEKELKSKEKVSTFKKLKDY